MKCSSCGSNTWVNRGTGSKVLCKKCLDNGESRPFVYFQETPKNPEETPVDLGEISVQFKETPDKHEEENSPVKSKSTQVKFNQVPVDYQSSVLIAKFISSIGWFICCVALLIVFISLTSKGEIELFSLGASLGLFSSGLLVVVVVQVCRVLFEVIKLTGIRTTSRNLED